MKRRRGHGMIALLLLPAFLIILAFYVVPAVLTGAMSLTNMDHRLSWNFVGIENYKAMLQDTILNRVFWNTLLYVFGTLLCFNVTFGLLLALATSYIAERQAERTSMFFRALWLLPRFTPPIVYGVIWLWILDPTRNGLLNGLINFFGGKPISWISEFPMPVIILTNGVIGASFGMILFYSAITSISREHNWAAAVDGAGWLQRTRYVTLPLIRWPLMFVTAYQTLSLLTSYEYILIITGGGPFYRTTVWSLYAYNEAFGGYYASYRFGYATALTMVLVLISLVASIIYWRVFRFREMMSDPKIEVI
ncbi:MAG: sugar ABC transporter permease [Bacillota bacterium]|nr:sugar ABC transporter permease [Bacillota bacterium]